MNMSQIPSEVLEQRAAEQRRRLHNSVSKLRSSVTEAVREKLDVKRYIIQYMGPVTAVTALAGLMFGYSTAGIFTRE
jgi:hypothetical protein